jgi:hypothetical protein
MLESDVSRDILSNPMYKGAIDSIQGLVNVVDGGFAMVITFVAFFIISVALLKNVLAGAYCAFPKFWDKVDLAHQEMAEVGFVQQFKNIFSSQGVQQINMGTISRALLRIMPNIKTLTDFEDNTLGYRNYFIRAIPQMIIVIIIGAFIYNGYYRDTAAKVVDFGSEIFYRTVLTADPIALFDRVTGTAGRPNFSTENSVDKVDMDLTKVYNGVYDTIFGTYSDISTAEEKARLTSSIESIVRPWVEEFIEYFGNPQWRMTTTTELVMGNPDLTYADRGFSSDKLLYQRVNAWSIADWSLISNKEVDRDWYVMTRITFSKVPVQPVSTLTNLVLYLPASNYASGRGGSVTLDDTIKCSTTSFKIGEATFRGSPTGVNVYNANSTTDVPAITKGEKVGCTNLFYYFNKQSYKINAVVIENGRSSIGFKADNVEEEFSPSAGPSTEKEEKEEKEEKK